MDKATHTKSHHGNEQVCPQCGKVRVGRSRRKNLNDYILSLGGLYPYRCRECNYRYHVRRQHRSPRKFWWAQCPKCFSTEIHRIARDKVPLPGTNIFRRALGFPAYRCPRCRTRFFDARPRKRVPAGPELRNKAKD